MKITQEQIIDFAVENKEEFQDVLQALSLKSEGEDFVEKLNTIVDEMKAKKRSYFVVDENFFAMGRASDMLDHFKVHALDVKQSGDKGKLKALQHVTREFHQFTSFLELVPTRKEFTGMDSIVNLMERSNLLKEVFINFENELEKLKTKQ